MMTLIFNILLSTIISKADLVMLPKDCINHKAAKCSVWNKNTKGYELKVGAMRVLLQPDSIVSVEEKNIELISGTVSLSGEQVEVDTSYAVFTCMKCYSQFYLSKGKLQVKHAEGNLVFKPIDKGDSIEFPVGFETNFYAIDPISGKSRYEVFRPVDLSSFLSFYESFPAGEREKWQGRKSFFTEKAREASEAYKKEADRQIAAIQEKKELQQKVLKQQEKENEEIRRLFRQKNYLE